MRLAANGIALEVEDHGSPQGEPLVLVMGLGMQLLAWHEDFVASLVARGFRVIRFDNRDIGLSQGFDAAGVPIECSHDLFRADRTRITVRTHGRSSTSGSAVTRGKVLELRAHAY